METIEAEQISTGHGLLEGAVTRQIQQLETHYRCALFVRHVSGLTLTAEGNALLTVAVGSDNNVAKGWHGKVLRGDSDTPLDGGDVTVIRVGKRETIGKVHLTTDQVGANPRVKLSPP